MSQAQGSTKEGEERDNSELVLQGLFQMLKKGQELRSRIGNNSSSSTFLQSFTPRFLGREGTGEERGLKRALQACSGR